MLHPCGGIRRVVRVFGEDLVGRDKRLELDEVAALTGEHAKREERLHLPGLIGPEEVLAKRRHPEVDDDEFEWRAAEAARRLGLVSSQRIRGCRFGVDRMHWAV